jgi:hypothetical protein
LATIFIASAAVSLDRLEKCDLQAPWDSIMRKLFNSELDTEAVFVFDSFDTSSVNGKVYAPAAGDALAAIDTASAVIESSSVSASDQGFITSLMVPQTDVVDSHFDIVIRYTGDPTYQAAFTQAVARWEQIITADIPDFNSAQFGVIDDLLIDASIVAIDGPGHILGQAGPDVLRSGSLQPAHGVMKFDSADVAQMFADGIWTSVILHEMGHVLGLGTIWDSLHLKNAAGDYIGAHALAEYRTLTGNQGATSIPVEHDGGPGTAGGHWDEETFTTELMTGYAEPAGVPMAISRMTIGSLQDMGYTVNYAAADTYSLPGGPAPAADDFADSLTDATAPIGQGMVNGLVTGKLEVTGDHDWFRIQLIAGTSYTIGIQGAHGGGGTLADPYLRLHNSAGAVVQENDDIAVGSNADSQLTYQATSTGSYYIDVGAFDDSYTGTYTVAVSSGIPDDFRDSLADATAPFGQVVVNGSGTGRLEVAGDRDWFQINLTAGASYVINLQGLQAGGGTLEDPYLRVHSSNGTLVAENDDIVLGINRDSQLTFTATTTGTYYLEAGAFNEEYTGTYKLSVNGAAAPTDDFRDSLTDTTAPLGSVAVNGSHTGTLEVTGDRDWFSIQLNAGTTYDINLQGLQAGGGTLEDPYLRIHNSSGALVAENDDIVRGINRDSHLTFQATTTGTYYLEAGAFDDNYTGTYRVSVSGATASRSLSNDFNGDGFSDILWRNNSSGDTGYTDFHAGNAWHGLGASSTAYGVVGAGDFNGDGFSDALWRNNSSGDTGYTDFHAGNAWHGLGVSPTAYSIVGTGDFNGDGFSDILYRNGASGDTGYSDLHGNAWHGLGAASTSYNVVGTGDFNGDGFSDVLWRNNSSGDTGYTDFHAGNAWHGLGASSTAYNVVGVGDFNGDGFSDVLWRNNSSGDTGYTDFHAGNAWHGLGASSTAYSIVGTGDFNGDGFGDILYRNGSSGDTGYSDLHGNAWHGLGAASTAYLIVA